MKLLITGGAGKVGQAIVRELLNSAAYEITVLDRTPGPERGPVNYLVGDIQDLGQVMEAMAGAEAVEVLVAYVVESQPFDGGDEQAFGLADGPASLAVFEEADESVLHEVLDILRRLSAVPQDVAHFTDVAADTLHPITMT